MGDAVATGTRVERHGYGPANSVRTATPLREDLAGLTPALDEAETCCCEHRRAKSSTLARFFYQRRCSRTCEIRVLDDSLFTLVDSSRCLQAVFELKGSRNEENHNIVHSMHNCGDFGGADGRGGLLPVGSMVREIPNELFHEDEIVEDGR